MTCLSSAKYTHRIDVYEQQVTQSESGAVKRAWNIGSPTQTISGRVQSIQLRGLGTGGSEETWGQEYVNVQYLRVFTATRLNNSLRIGNVRDNRGGQLFTGVFEIIGEVVALYPLSGSASEFQYTVRQAEI